MEVKKIFEYLNGFDYNYYGELSFNAKSDIVEWQYDGLANSSIYNDDQLNEICEVDCDIIKDLLYDYGITNFYIEEPIINNNTISFEINFE